jgi:hypothetical protein
MKKRPLSQVKCNTSGYMYDDELLTAFCDLQGYTKDVVATLE